MLNHYDPPLYDGYLTDDELPADEYNSLVRILDSQLVGALEGIGEGIITGGEVQDDVGLSVTISALKAIVETDYGLCYIASSAEVTLTGLPPNVSLWFWAQALLPDDGDYDSRETGVVRFIYTQVNVQPPNSIALAEATTTAAAVTIDADTRVYVPGRAGANFAAQIAALEAAVGIPYGAVDDLDTRVTDLEAGAVAGGGYEYWETMPKNVGDTTPPGQEMDTKDDVAIDEHVADYHADDGGTEEIEVNEPWDVDAVNQARHLLKYTESVDPDGPETQIDAATVVWDCYGEGNGHDELDYVDRVNSTWLPT